jgi:hypothetical protein
MRVVGNLHPYVLGLLVLLHLMPEIFGKYSATSFITSLRLRVEACGLNFLYFEQFAWVFVHFLTKLAPW